VPAISASFSGRSTPRQKISFAAEELLDQKVVEELHVGRREADCRVNAVVERPLLLQPPEVGSEAAAQRGGEPLEHLAEVPILELQHVDVHQQPEVRVRADQFPHHPPEAPEALGMKGLFDLVEDRAQPCVNHLLVAPDDGLQNVFLRRVVVVQVAERSPRALRDVAHRGGVEAALDEQLARGLLDAAAPRLHSLLTEFGHTLSKKRTSVILSSRGVLSTLLLGRATKRRKPAWPQAVPEAEDEGGAHFADLFAAKDEG
jgi:hypothetical protein